jgi:S-(hydroxymethyl)glutathione dehydrogenase/alcohol dehydrogenase
MKAAILRQFNGIFDIEDITIDKPIGHEVLVQVKASGLCHSDLHAAKHDLGFFPVPSVFGHELAGIVAEVGPDVSDFSVGDHVVACLVRFCGHCSPCNSGHSYHCAHPDDTLRAPAQRQRLSQDGRPIHQIYGLAGFAEQALVHENQLVKVPDAMPFPQAAVLGCATVTGAGAAINTASIKAGDTVAVIGAGGVGLNVISGAKLMGATRIIAIDLNGSKLDLAKRFGATDVVDAGKTDPIEAVNALTGGGVDHAFEVVGLVSTTLQAIRIARRGGGAYLIGVHQPGSKIELDVLGDILVPQRRLEGVYMGSTNIKRDIPMYADLYIQGRLNLDDLISNEISIGEINEAYRQLGHGAIARSVITRF